MSLTSPPAPTKSSRSMRGSLRQANRRHRGRAATVLTVAFVSLALVGASAPAGAQVTSTAKTTKHAFKQVNLVSDIKGLAQITDKKVKNPWGIDFGPQTPLWVSNEGTNSLTLYSGATKSHSKAVKLGLEVKASHPTGMVFNPTKKFKVRTSKGKTAPANFIMNENLFTDTSATGEITGWSSASTSPTKTVVKARTTKGEYTGLALLPATQRRGPRLLAVNDITGHIDVYDGKYRLRHWGSKAFADPKAKADQIVAYNVAYLKGRVYVAYAPAGQKGTSAVSVFKTNGRFVKRLTTGGPLLAPWGMAIAPRHWGGFGGSLLVGNVGDGTINAFDRYSGHFRGVLKDGKGKPLVNVGLWGLKFGNGVIGTRNTLIFAAGIGETPTDFDHFYEHGLIGAITPTPHD